MDTRLIDKRLKELSQLKTRLRNDIKKEYQYIDLINENLSDEEISNRLGDMNFNSLVDIDVEVEWSDEEKKEYLNFLYENYDKGFFDDIKPLLDKMPESNGSRFYNHYNVNVGIVADEFLYNSFKDSANFIYITKSNYKDYADQLDLFFLATTWKGLDMSWRGLANPNNRKHRQDMFEIIDFYQSKGIKTVFYSKEDPFNYDNFVELAARCDYIFTTEESKVKDYKMDCNNENVNVLKFGINPVYHNPIGFRKFEKRQDVLFAGSWYIKYPERQLDTRTLFDGVIQAGHDLKIIDRNFDMKLTQHFFPQEYVQFISPALNHSELQKLHKLFDWSMNLNSVKYSKTMFANRVYEAQALGNILLSNYSVGINNMFPNVFIVNDKNEVSEILNGFNEEEKYQHQIFGIRRVMSRETTFHRLEQILQTIQFSFTKVERKIAVVVKDTTSEIQEAFNRQTYQNKTLITLDELDDDSKKKYDMLTFFDEDKFYGEFYLENMINAFKYTDCDYITKDAYLSGRDIISGVEHDYIDQIKDKARTIFWSQAFSLDELLQLNQPINRHNGYSIDHFDYNHQLQNKMAIDKEPQVSVIIPAYNNGDHLLNKCFKSLKRSSLFEDMEIIIVDDGSSDDYTPKVINYIARQYNNVKTYFYNDGGSGSASRPRNKGFELSKAPYITYLDPDNEAINDGYRVLYEEIKNSEYDFVVGNVLRLDEKVMQLNYYRTAMSYNGSSVIKGEMEKYLVKTVFKAMSIQALILKRELIANHSLTMVEGAVGQDTLFFQELLLNSNRVKVIDLDIHVYYAAVSGSTVNSISKRFFEKYLPLEKVRLQTYKKHDILEDYIDTRFNDYFKNWYLKKLKNVDESGAIDSIQIISQILDLYMGDREIDDPVINRFAKLRKANDYQTIIDELN